MPIHAYLDPWKICRPEPKHSLRINLPMHGSSEQFIRGQWDKRAIIDHYSVPALPSGR